MSSAERKTPSAAAYRTMSRWPPTLRPGGAFKPRVYRLLCPSHTFLENFMAETKRNVETNVDRLSQSAHDAVDKAASVATSYAERFSSKGDELMQIPKPCMQSPPAYVPAHPPHAL